MTYTPVPHLEKFAEAISVVPFLHVPADRPVKVLAVGPYALPVAKLALRYPNVAEIHLSSMETATFPNDRRAIRHETMADIPDDLKADIVALALPSDPIPRLLALKQHMAPEGVIVVALDTFDRGRKVKDAMSKLWTQVIPYREHAPEPVLFLLASDRRFGRFLRPIPKNLKRLSEAYIPTLFTFAKDEHFLLYGNSIG